MPSGLYPWPEIRYNKNVYPILLEREEQARPKRGKACQFRENKESLAQPEKGRTTDEGFADSGARIVNPAEGEDYYGDIPVENGEIGWPVTV